MVLLRLCLRIIFLTVLLRLLPMLLRRDYFFDGLVTATGSVTTPRDFFTATGSATTATGYVTTQGLSFRPFSYGYWQCYYA